MFTRYLADWLELPADRITRAMARARHAHITVANGPVAANTPYAPSEPPSTSRKRVQDAPLGENPAEAVTYHLQRSREAVIVFPDIPRWL